MVFMAIRSDMTGMKTTKDEREDENNDDYAPKRSGWFCPKQGERSSQYVTYDVRTLCTHLYSKTWSSVSRRQSSIPEPRDLC